MSAQTTKGITTVEQIATPMPDARSLMSTIELPADFGPSNFQVLADQLVQKHGLCYIRAYAIVVEAFNTRNGTNRIPPNEHSHNTDQDWPPGPDYVLKTCPGEVWEPDHEN
jgi:hypothetical protein